VNTTLLEPLQLGAYVYPDSMGDRRRTGSREGFPKRIPISPPQADYWRGWCPFNLIQNIGGANEVEARSPVFCSHPEGGADAPGNAWNIVRRPGDWIEIHGGVVNVSGAFPATALSLELWGSETNDAGSFHWIRTSVDLTAAQALRANYGVGTAIQGGPRFWYARLYFAGLAALPAGFRFCQMWVSS
jgi:hypothetical protein